MMMLLVYTLLVFFAGVFFTLHMVWPKGVLFEAKSALRYFLRTRFKL